MQEKRRKRCIPNGMIYSSLRLNIASRLFASRCLLGISLAHSMSVAEVHCSTWKVMGAARQNKSLNIEYPAYHKKQKQIISKTEKTSFTGFNNCAGHTDSLLIWMRITINYF